MNSITKRGISKINPRRRGEATRTNARLGIQAIFGAMAILLSLLFVPSLKAKTNAVINVSGDPANIFECSLTATQMDVTIAGQTVHAFVYKDDAPGAIAPCPCDGIPVLVMRLKVGQTVICHFKNNLPTDIVSDGASIHWHGIELDNESDGTAVTQDALREGQIYNYRFKVTRPGLFWFHSHMTPGNTTFAGMYGAILIPNNIESTLIANNSLPPPQYTFTLALSDIEFNPSNGTPDYGKVGKFFTFIATNTNTMVITTNKTWETINDLVNICHQNPNTSGSNRIACGLAGTPGKVVLLNGENPDTTPTTNDIPSGQRIRMHLLNEALSRHFRLKLLDPASNSISMYRIGGQGGLLNNPRLEGGIQGTRNSGYEPGEIAVGSGDRVDVIALLSGNEGDIIKLVGNPLNKKPGPTFKLSEKLMTNYPVAYFRIHGTKATPDSTPCPCDNLLAGTSEQVPKLTGPTNSLITPAPFGGSADLLIRLTNAKTTNGQNKTEPAIDLAEGALEGNMGNGDFLTVPRLKTSRYARVGDLLEFSVRNETDTVHPFHLHGFSLQPMMVIQNAETNVESGVTNITPATTIYTYDYNEFVDTIDVYGTGENAAQEATPGQTLVFRVKIEDRGKMCDDAPSFPPGPVLKPCTSSTNGGAIGRWLFHCHIFSHAGLGMMSELTIVDPAPSPQQTNWMQRPQFTTNGLDILATALSGSQTVADDFRFASNGYITSISIWGSWSNNIQDTNAAFELKFWTDVPAFDGRPSRPGWQAWRQLFPRGTYTSSLESSNIAERFYDPSQPSVLLSDTNVFRYDFVIPQSQAFLSRSNTVYWLSVTAYTTNSFGWKTSLTNDHFNDYATWSPTLFGPHWTNLVYPSGNLFAGTGIDTSFQLTTPAGPAPSPVLLPPALSVTVADGILSISWQEGAILQAAPEVEGPWSDLETAENPYVAVMTEQRRFYRVRLP